MYAVTYVLLSRHMFLLVPKWLLLTTKTEPIPTSAKENYWKESNTFVSFCLVLDHIELKEWQKSLTVEKFTLLFDLNLTKTYKTNF